MINYFSKSINGVTYYDPKTAVLVSLLAYFSLLIGIGFLVLLIKRGFKRDKGNGNTSGKYVYNTVVRVFISFMAIAFFSLSGFLFSRWINSRSMSEYYEEYPGENVWFPEGRGVPDESSSSMDELQLWRKEQQDSYMEKQLEDNPILTPSQKENIKNGKQ